MKSKANGELPEGLATSDTVRVLVRILGGRGRGGPPASPSRGSGTWAEDNSDHRHLPWLSRF